MPLAQSTGALRFMGRAHNWPMHARSSTQHACIDGARLRNQHQVATAGHCVWGCRVIASQASVPLVYVPLEAVASKWYGESEKLLSQIFEAVAALDGAIVFLDELDALATTRRCPPLLLLWPLLHGHLSCLALNLSGHLSTLPLTFYALLYVPEQVCLYQMSPPSASVYTSSTLRKA